MDRVVRQQIARDLCHRLATRDGERLIVAGMIESATLPNEFDPLALLVISTPPRLCQSFLVQGITVTVTTITPDELTAVVRTPDVRWPQWLGWLARLQVLVGDDSRVQAWLAQARALPERDFYRRIAPHMPQLAFGCYGALRAAAARRQEREVRWLVPILLTELHTALCLINRRWSSHNHIDALVESYHFALQPRDWPPLVEALLAASDLDEIVRLAGTIMGNYWQLLVRCELTVEQHQTTATVPL
ncbi:MAG: hypothetical protein C0184_09935 [Chloroflexus aggregans]|uniref:DUF4037 domain-containing protein n=1 Tax=Chloroflexus aggregans TaxID=152260 RepID=A0A2J6X3D6_9CHLR|nr:MAG: hypothetical protein C0184_09935 [Chloroflexus aggregans]